MASAIPKGVGIASVFEDVEGRIRGIGEITTVGVRIGWYGKTNENPAHPLAH